MLKTRTSAILSLALVFVSGALLGALGFRAYNSSASSAQRRPSPAEWRKVYINQMRDRVRLDDQQVVQLGKILDKGDDEWRPVLAKRRTEDMAFPGSMIDKMKGELADERSKLGLTGDQANRVNQIIDSVNQEFGQIFAKRRTENQAFQASLNDRIDAILRPDQRVLFKQFRDERQKERERARREAVDAKQGRDLGRPPMGPAPDKK